MQAHVTVKLGSVILIAATVLGTGPTGIASPARSVQAEPAKNMAAASVDSSRSNDSE